LKKRILIPAIFIVLAALAILFYWLWQKNNYVGSIGKEKVSKAEYIVFLRAQANLFLDENQVYETTGKMEFWDKEIGGKNTKDIVRERTADKLIEFKVQLARARKAGMRLERRELEDVKDYIEQLMDSASPSKNEKEREREFVKMFGVTPREYEEVYRNVRIVRKYATQEINSMEPSEDEMLSYYRENRDFIDNFTIRDILFATVNLKTGAELSEEEKLKAGSRALQVLQLLQEGIDAEQLALDHSDDPKVGANKGQFTFKIPRDRQNEIESWTMKSKPGDTGIVQAFNGYHVLKLEKRSAYEEVKQDVAQMLAEEKYKKMLESLRKDPANEFVITNREFIDSIEFSF